MANPIIDFNANTDHYFGEAKRFRLHKHTTFPSTLDVPAGWLIDMNGSVYYWDGASWINLGQVYTHPDYTLASNPFLTEQTSGLQILSQILTNSTGHVTKIAARNLTNADIVSVFLNDAIQSGTFTWSSNKIKTFVENTLSQSITGALIYQPSNYVPALAQGSMTAPLPVTSTSIKQGMVWVVTANGWVGSQSVSVGDMIIAKIDNASNVEANYQIIEKNIPDIVAATEVVRGIIQIATEAEAIAGNDTDKAMTPKTTKAVFDAKIKSQTWNFGDGSSLSFSFPHNYGTKNITADVWRNSDGKKINVAITTPTDNSVMVDVLNPIAVNEYRLTIITRL